MNRHFDFFKKLTQIGAEPEDILLMRGDSIEISIEKPKDGIEKHPRKVKEIISILNYILRGKTPLLKAYKKSISPTFPAYENPLISLFSYFYTDEKVEKMKKEKKFDGVYIKIFLNEQPNTGDTNIIHFHCDGAGEDYFTSSLKKLREEYKNLKLVEEENQQRYYDTYPEF